MASALGFGLNGPGSSPGLSPGRGFVLCSSAGHLR